MFEANTAKEDATRHTSGGYYQHFVCKPILVIYPLHRPICETMACISVNNMNFGLDPSAEF